MFPATETIGSADLKYINKARKICEACPVQQECLDWAVTLPSTDVAWGVWAGMTSRQLANEQNRRINQGLMDPEDIQPTLYEIWKSFTEDASESV